MLRERSGNADTGHVGIGDLRGIRDEVGQEDALQAHACLDPRAGEAPVQIAVLDLDDLPVGAQGPAVAGTAPGGPAYLEIDAAGKGIGHRGIQLQAHAVLGLETVLAPAAPALHVFSFPVLADEAAAIPVFEHGDPDPFDTKVHGVGAGRGHEAPQQCPGQQCACHAMRLVFPHLSSFEICGMFLKSVLRFFW